MNILTKFAILCLFSATAFANEPTKEFVIPHAKVVLASTANPKYAAVLERSTVKARLDNIQDSRNGHVLITTFEKLGRGNVAEEYTVHAVWMKN